MMVTRRCRCGPVLCFTLATILVVSALGTGRVAAQFTITQIIDSTGDGAGNSLFGAFGIAVDAAGNVYVTGAPSNNAFKITPAGMITQIIDATGDGAGNGLSNPLGIAVDAAGNVYVIGGASANVFKITPGGVITQIIDATGDGAGNMLDDPAGIAVDIAGNVYVAGISSHNAFKITPAGVTTQIIDSSGDGAGNSLFGPRGIAVDAASNVYVAGGSRNAFKITPAGVITQIINETGDGAGNFLFSPGGIAVDAAGNVYVSGRSSSNAFKITPAGVITQIIDFSGDGAGHFLHVADGIAVDPAGNVYVAGINNSNAFKITPAGVITQIIDETGDGAGNVLTIPLGRITVDAAGTVYVPGFASSNAFRITTDCNGNTVADATDIANGTSQDCNANIIPDECEPDCNGNATPDPCEILDGTATDCNGNGIPDDCEPDCNTNGVADFCDIRDGTSPDCNLNGIPDECEPDCNGNGVTDSCDISDGTSQDCTSNGIPDECEPDCNGNGIADSCDILNGVSLDCNGDVVPDECQLVGNDCNNNFVPDECDPDCNRNGIPDSCDISSGSSDDCNGNGVPDDCEGTAFGSGLDFDGADDWVRVRRADSLEPTGELTIEVWIRPDSAGGSNSRIVRNAGNFAPGYILSWSQSGNRRLQLRIDGAVSGNARATDPLPTSTYFGQWLHVAGVYSAAGNFARLYVNGVLKDDQPGVGTMLFSGDDLLIGNFTAASNEDFDGLIDEVRIWNVARTQQEITDHKDVALTGAEPGLVGYWRFNEGVGQLALDSSPSKNDGVLGNDNSPAGDSRDPAWVAPGAPIQEGDCNDNGVLDECDIAANPASDCDANGIPDECELGAGDCNGNGITDRCEPGGAEDCNGNGVSDLCDVFSGLEVDCNQNGTPDVCELYGVAASIPVEAIQNPNNESFYFLTPTMTSWTAAEELAVSLGGHLATVRSLQENQWIFDTFSGQTGASGLFIGLNDLAVEGTFVWISGEAVLFTNWDAGEPNNLGNEDVANIVLAGPQTTRWNDVHSSTDLPGVIEFLRVNDCNRNGTLDECDIAIGTSSDCDANGIPDECESDCNANGIPDECDIADGTSQDCNMNLLPDECEPPANDCDGNGVPNECEPDCNENGVADDCDIVASTSQDCQPNGIPDDCEVPGFATATLEAADRGWWNDGGFHVSTNNNTYTGLGGFSGSDVLNSYFIFEVSSVAPFDIAILRLEVEGYFSSHASQSLTVYDVSTDPATLEASGTDVGIFNDLQSGSTYATFAVTPGDVGSILEIPLNALAASAIETSSGFFAVGLHLNSVGPSNEGVRFSVDNEQRVHQLVLGFPPHDCNANGIPDDCDIAAGTSTDIFGTGGQADGIPDECQSDCNGNGIPDVIDIANGTSGDCNGNDVPDECDSNLGGDCNTNGIPDACDIADGISLDCDNNGIPDECEPDCNSNGVTDVCDIASQTSQDCNANGVPDDCEPDCNANGVADACDISSQTSQDCNANGVPDECDPDCDGDGVPDECQPRQPCWQWATSVFDFSSQFSSPQWAAAQALGVPDVFVFGDSANAWAPLASDGTIEFISLGFTSPVFATGVTVRENLSNGFVIQVDAIDTNDVLHTMWTGTDPSEPGQVVDFLITWPETLFLVKGVKIIIDTDLDQSDWEEIDAAQLHGFLTSIADCNGNGIPDDCDIACGASGEQCDVVGCGGSQDCNANGIPDECETCGDFDGDGVVDAVDFTIFLGAFGLGVGAVGFEPCADADGDSVITFVDYQQWLQCYRSFVGNPLAPPPVPENVGDMDGNGTVNGNDIQPFVEALLEPATAGLRGRFMADANGDGSVDSADVGEFVGLLLSQS